MSNTLMAMALVATSFTIALAVLLAFALMARGRRPGLLSQKQSEEDQIVFLFEGEHLVDASREAHALLSSGQRTGTEWTHLAGLLQPRFPGLRDWIQDLADMGEISMPSTDGSSRLDAEWHHGVARLTLVDVETAEGQVELDRHSLTAMRNELETLRSTAKHVPYMVWRETADGQITWANRTYLDLAEALDPAGETPPWPPRAIFDRPRLAAVEDTDADEPRRVALNMPDDDSRHWFDIQQENLGDEVLFTALPADKVVRAETSLSEFVTTLTKTFAHLPIGLAIFDRDRKLALFNPALTDLTALPITFLVAKPSLFSFLDCMREKRMMPEPKDYKSWRQQMSELEAQAVDGTYEETWALPTGQTYRVTGRPHPDGAVAFLFEDITAEISLTRRFRSELEMGQSALDCLGEAVAVFRPGSGVLAMSNNAYAKMWGNDPSTSFEDMTITDASINWQRLSTPTPVWEKLRKFVVTPGDRTEWTASVTLKDGRVIDGRFTPMARGATMATFRLSEAKTESMHPKIAAQG